VGRCVGFVLVIVMLCGACAPPPVRRPLEGAPPNAESGAISKEDGRAPSSSGVPPTLSANGPSPVGSASPGLASAAEPAPSPSPSPEPGYIIVATDGRGANLRDGPGTSSRVLTTLAEGTAVEVFEEQVTVSGRAWRRIRSGSREGWVVAPVVRRR
jgi:hypothetical protein